MNGLNLFFKRLDQSSGPPPVQSSLLQPPSSVAPVYCPTPAYTPFPTTSSPQPPCTSTSFPVQCLPPAHNLQHTAPPSCPKLSPTTNQVRKELRRMKAREVGISSRLLKSCVDQLGMVEHVFILSWEVPPPKDLNNYRPLALT